MMFFSMNLNIFPFINELKLILYNYSLLLRSIQVFMDLKNDIHQSL